MPPPPPTTPRAVARGAVRLSRRILLSYIIDWILILATAAVGGVFSKIDGNRHAFSLEDGSISFPYKAEETVTTGVLLIVSILVPGAVITIVCLLLVPGAAAPRSTPKGLIWRRKLWEWNTGWMGLGVALAGAFFVTEGLKDLLGKPRPDFLARCQPDPNMLAQYTVGGLGRVLDEAPIVVDWHICRNPQNSVISDGFASFPSGHSSFSFAGMTYLTLFLCAKFAISIPFLAPAPYRQASYPTFQDDAQETSSELPPRNQAAAPPVHLLILAFIPMATALFIASSRWADYRHHGFDIIVGSLIGITFAWLGFRLYHLPIRRGAGWSWGSRSRNRAYAIGLGVPSYVGDEGWESSRIAKARAEDVEGNAGITGPGIEDRPQIPPPAAEQADEATTSTLPPPQPVSTEGKHATAEA